MTKRSSKKKRGRKAKSKKSKSSRPRKRRRGNVYLGVVVPDTGRPGLDNDLEAAGIMGAIMEDYRRGRISAKLARARLALLKLVAKKRKARSDQLNAMLRKAMRKLAGD